MCNLKINLFLLCTIGIINCSVSILKNDNPKANYRLPKHITPVEYMIDIKLYSDSFQKESFSGKVTIKLNIKKDTNFIQLHTTNMKINHISLFLTNNNTQLSYTSSVMDNITDILTINFNNTLYPSDNYNLIIDYIGHLSSTDMYGFYQSTYKDDKNKVKYLATTQFETTHARKAFPCFDEPEFKATFTIQLTYPNDFQALSNNPIDGDDSKPDDENMVTRKFKKSPIMSTYLVAFIISEFTKTDSTDTKVRMWAKSGTENKRKIALEYAPKLLNQMGIFTNISYDSHGIGKMDIVAIPDFAAGAMENWGLVTYREVLLIDDGNETSNIVKQRIVTVIAHEFAHSWFGDLVTTNWWSNIWLNEGFATYFEYHITNEVEKNWELHKQHLLDIKLLAMQTDGFSTAPSLSEKEENVNSPAKADKKFDVISYSKGSSIITMMNSFLGDDKFKSGLNFYLNKHKNGNTQPSDLWEAFQNQNLKDNLNMSSTMDSWVNKPGYPVINVKYINKNELEISQARFIFDTSRDNSTTLWTIPITYAKNKDKIINTLPDQWLNGKSIKIKENVDDNEWILFNNQAKGYYRVNYDLNLWKRIIDAYNGSSFSDAAFDQNKAQLIDDAFKLARANLLDYRIALDLSSGLKNDNSYYSWLSAFQNYGFLLKRVGQSDLGEAITNKLSFLMSSLMSSVSYDEKPNEQIYTLKQTLALTWACKLKNNSCIDYAKSQFENYKKNNKKPYTNFRGFIYCNALRNSEDVSDWEFLWGNYLKSQSSAEKNTMLYALGCTKNETILNNYLIKSITADQGIRKQDGLTVFRSVYQENSKGVDIALKFLKDHKDEINAYYKGMGALQSIYTGIADQFTTQAQVDEFKEFLNKEQLNENVMVIVNNAIEIADTNIKWIQHSEYELNDYFDLNKKGAATNILISSILYILPVFILSAYYL